MQSTLTLVPRPPCDIPSVCRLQYVLQATKAGCGGLGMSQSTYCKWVWRPGNELHVDYTVVSIIPRPFPPPQYFDSLQYANIGIGNGLGMRLHCGYIYNI